MEFVDGQTLRDIVKTEGPLAGQRAMEIMADVCAALDFSHRHGIIHRDVKPANVMINQDGAVKVMDFGIARALADGQGGNPDRRGDRHRPVPVPGAGPAARRWTRAVTSTPPAACCSSCSPASRRSPATPRSRWPTSTSARTPQAAVAAEPGGPAGRWTRSCSRRCSKNPANRYQSAAEMRADLVRVLYRAASAGADGDERGGPHRDARRRGGRLHPADPADRPAPRPAAGLGRRLRTMTGGAGGG